MFEAIPGNIFHDPVAKHCAIASLQENAKITRNKMSFLCKSKQLRWMKLLDESINSL